MVYVKSIYLDDNKSGFMSLSKAIKGIGTHLAKIILNGCNIAYQLKLMKIHEHSWQFMKIHKQSWKFLIG